MVRAQYGFTLIEVMVALTVLAILISLGAPSFAEWLQSQRIRAAAEALTNGLQVARGEAIRRNLPVSLGLEPTRSGFTVCEATVSPCDSTTPAPPAPNSFIQSKSPQEGGGNAIVSTKDSTGLPGATLVTFSPLGSVIDNPGGSPRLARVDVGYPSGLCSADGGTLRCLRIVIAPGGSIRMCDPTPTIVAPDPRACP